MARLARLLAVLVCATELALGAEAQCKIPYIARGTVRMRQRNKLARFACWLGYELLGDKYATCVDGHWDTPQPVCTKAGCSRLPSLVNGMQYYMKRNAIVMFFCAPGFQIEGAGFAYCDGNKWNGTQPQCVVDSESSGALHECNFERENLCGWSHDPVHDFSWQRHSGATPSGHVGTGPPHDHTTGFGHYMYIESSSRLENDTARLLSPLYPPSMSTDACFVFYYHMYGRTTGALRVYVHAQNAADANFTWERRGDQGNRWFRGYFRLERLHDNFQMVLEGVRGPGYVSDIAVDDVALLTGDKCLAIDKEIEASTPPTARDSCLNRCKIPGQSGDDELYECACVPGCGEEPSEERCCVDYRDFCVFDVSEDYVSTLVIPSTWSVQSTTEQATSAPTSTNTTSTTAPSKTTPKTTTTSTPAPSTTTSSTTTPTTTTPSTTSTSTIRSTQVVRKTRTTLQDDVITLKDRSDDDETETMAIARMTESNPRAVSKTYWHYGRDENGLHSSVIAEAPKSSISLIYVVGSLIVVAAVGYVVKKKYWSRWGESGRTGGDGSVDIRFLVQHEELENY